MKLYQKIARVVSLENTALKAKELASLNELLPKGNGIEAGCAILLKSTRNKIVIDTAYNHPNGSYVATRWTNHQVVVTPAFEGEINIRITGKNENDIKDFLFDVFREALMKEYALD